MARYTEFITKEQILKMCLCTYFALFYFDGVTFLSQACFCYFSGLLNFFNYMTKLR